MISFVSSMATSKICAFLCYMWFKFYVNSSFFKITLCFLVLYVTQVILLEKMADNFFNQVNRDSGMDLKGAQKRSKERETCKVQWRRKTWALFRQSACIPPNHITLDMEGNIKLMFHFFTMHPRQLCAHEEVPSENFFTTLLSIFTSPTLLFPDTDF